MRIGLQGLRIDAAECPASNIVFLLDLSGSMRSADKLPLLRQAMKLLVRELGENDRVTIVTYADNARLRLDSTSGDQQNVIVHAIDSLVKGGSTNGSAGIQLAYEKAVDSFIEGGTDRVILATDGDLNVGITNESELVELIQRKAQSGVFLTVLGLGAGNLQDSKLEKLADKGNGMYAYVDSLREARKILVEEITGSLLTIARDVKVQVEFNPTNVHFYRLIGYENRLLKPEDFDNDAVDAGEIGAGHTVTALYEIVPVGAHDDAATTSQELEYQSGTARAPLQLTDAARSDELLTLWLRYKAPDSDESQTLEFTLKDSTTPFGRLSVRCGCRLVRHVAS